MGTLSLLTPGATAVVAGVDADPAVARRLASLGFRPGTTVSCVRRAPMGDPTVYRLRSYEVCLRRREAGFIAVTTPDAESTPRA
jgi:ferrous iron transport protein A